MPGLIAVIGALVRRAARPALAAAALCGLTYLVLVPAWRYGLIAADLLAPTVGAAGEAGARPVWRANGGGVALAREGDTVIARLSAAGPGGPVPLMSAPLRLPAGTDAVRARVELKATGLEAGRDAWQQGRLQIYGHDARGAFVWYWPKDVATIDGTTPWRSFEAIVPAGAQAPYMQALIYNGGIAGLLEARGVQIAALRVRPVFSWLRGLVGLAWGALGLWAVWALFAAPGRPAYRGATLALAVVALAGTLTPQPQFGRLTTPIEAGLRDWLRAPPPPPAEQQDQVPNTGSATATPGAAGGAAGGASAADRAQPAASSAESRAAAGAPPGANAARRANDRSGPLVRPPPEPAPWSGPSLKQVGHFTVFTLLALAAFVAYGSVHSAAIAGYLLVFALATETMQLFLITRSARAMDLAVDGAGILLAWAVLAALRAVARGRWGRAGRAARDAGP